MNWYYYIALALILSQLLFSVQVYNNYRYALKKYKRNRWWYRPRTALLVPCKGLDSAFQKNVTSFFNQDYENYLLWFVVADKADPAYDELCKLKNHLSRDSKASDVQVLVAGAVRNSKGAKDAGQKGKILNPASRQGSNGAGQGQPGPDFAEESKMAVQIFLTVGCGDFNISALLLMLIIRIF